MKLKAYRVDNPGSWSTLCYAATAGQAKMLDFREFHDTLAEGFESVLAMRVTRVPVCDTYAILSELGIPTIDDDPRHQLRAGITVECHECGREIHSIYDDAFGCERPTPAVLCHDCATRMRREAS